MRLGIHLFGMLGVITAIMLISGAGGVQYDQPESATAKVGGTTDICVDDNIE